MPTNWRSQLANQFLNEEQPMSRKKPPEGLPEFQKLMKPLAQVPKKELEKQVEKYEQRKADKKRKS